MIIFILFYHDKSIRLKSEKKQIVLNGELSLAQNFFKISIDFLFADNIDFFGVLVIDANTCELMKIIQIYFDSIFEIIVFFQRENLYFLKNWTGIQNYLEVRIIKIADLQFLKERGFLKNFGILSLRGIVNIRK